MFGRLPVPALGGLAACKAAVVATRAVSKAARIRCFLSVSFIFIGLEQRSGLPVVFQQRLAHRPAARQQLARWFGEPVAEGLGESAVAKRISFIAAFCCYVWTGLELDFDSLCLRHLVDGVEGSCRVPGRVRGVVAELAVRPLDVHVQPGRGTPLPVGAKLDPFGRIQ